MVRSAAQSHATSISRRGGRATIGQHEVDTSIGWDPWRPVHCQREVLPGVDHNEILLVEQYAAGQP